MKLFVVTLLVATALADRLENTYLPPNNAKTAGGSQFLDAPTGAASNANPNIPSASYGVPSHNHASNPSTQYAAPSSSNGQNSFQAPPSAQYGVPNSSPSSRNGAPSQYEAPKASPYSHGSFGVPQGSPTAQYGAPSAQYGAPEGSARFGGPSGSGAEGPDAHAAILRLNNENNGDGSYSFDFETENKITHQETGELKNVGTQQEASSVHGEYSYVGPDGVTYTVTYVADENGFRASGEHLPTSPPIPEAIQRSLEQNAAEEAAANQQGYQQATGHQGYPSGPQGSPAAQPDDQSVVVDAAARQYQPPQAANNFAAKSNGKDGYRY